MRSRCTQRRTVLCKIIPSLRASPGAAISGLRSLVLSASKKVQGVRSRRFLAAYLQLPRFCPEKVTLFESNFESKGTLLTSLYLAGGSGALRRGSEGSEAIAFDRKPSLSCCLPAIDFENVSNFGEKHCKLQCFRMFSGPQKDAEKEE